MKKKNEKEEKVTDCTRSFRLVAVYGLGSDVGAIDRFNQDNRPVVKEIKILIGSLINSCVIPGLAACVF
jgi:hypothetical protein